KKRATCTVSNHCQPSVRFKLGRRASHDGGQDNRPGGGNREPLGAVRVIVRPTKIPHAGCVIAARSRRIIRCSKASLHAAGVVKIRRRVSICRVKILCETEHW